MVFWLTDSKATGMQCACEGACKFEVEATKGAGMFFRLLNLLEKLLLHLVSMAVSVCNIGT